MNCSAYFFINIIAFRKRLKILPKSAKHLFFSFEI